jgi:cytochrome P450
MSTSVDAGAPYGFDTQSPIFLADPYPVYARLRAEAPIVRIAPRWVASRYDDVDAILRSPSFGRRGYADLILKAFGPGPLHDSFKRWMLFMDPPDHTRLRALATRAFTPRAVERLRQSIRALVDQLLDDLGAAGGGDLVSLFAYPLPVMVMCDLLGVPADDRDEFRVWSDSLGRALQLSAATPELAAEGNEAALRLTEYFRNLVAEHRDHPRDDLLGALIAAEEDGGRLSDEELLATAVLLFFAGHETTVNLIGNGTLALLRHPEQWQLLHEDPGLSRHAVEELLRFETPVQMVSRVTLEDVDVSGARMAVGDIVTALIGSANRDPARFAEPDRLDLRRTDVHHLGFAAGPHYCLGAALARAEAEIAFASLVRRFPDLRLASDTVSWRQNAVLRGLESLAVIC